MKARFEFVNSDPRKIIAVVNFLEMLGISRKRNQAEITNKITL